MRTVTVKVEDKTVDIKFYRYEELSDKAKKMADSYSENHDENEYDEYGHILIEEIVGVAMDDNNIYDTFLNESTHSVKDKWLEHGGKVLSTDELFQLNDLLTAFFDGKRKK